MGPRVTIGEAVYILQGTTIQPYATLGDYALIASQVAISHHTVLGRAVFLSAGVVTAARMRLRTMCSLGLAPQWSQTSAS